MRLSYLDRPTPTATRRFWRLADYFTAAGHPWDHTRVSIRRAHEWQVDGTVWCAFFQLIALADEESPPEPWATLSFEPLGAQGTRQRGEYRRVWDRLISPLVVRGGYSTDWSTRFPLGSAKKRLRPREFHREARRLDRLLSTLGATAGKAQPPQAVEPAAATQSLRLLGDPWFPYVAGYERCTPRSIDGREWTACFKMHVMGDEAHPGHALPRLQASATIWPPRMTKAEEARLPRTAVAKRIRRTLVDAGYYGRWRTLRRVGTFGDFWKNLYRVREMQREARRLAKLDLLS